MQLKRVLAAITLSVSLLFPACTKTPPADGAVTISVAVTTDALYEMAMYIGGGRVTVTKMIPDGIELHDFEPRARDIVSLGEADMLIINGLGLEPWIDGAVTAAGRSNFITVDASYGIDALPAAEHGGSDPHIWLSLICAAIMAENIRDALIEADPGGEDGYADGCADFTARLDTLYKEYAKVFADAKSHTLVAGHAVFAYLCRDFGLTQESVEGVFSEGEPSPQRLAELVDYCRGNGVTTVFAESLSDRRIVDTLARDAGARVVTIYTIEGAEDGMSYLERMEYNLSAIAEAL